MIRNSGKKGTQTSEDYRLEKYEYISQYSEKGFALREYGRVFYIRNYM